MGSREKYYPPQRAPTEGRQLDEYTEISNDAAIVRVRKVRTGNGVRLEIHAPEKDRRVYLDPVNIESLAWQTPRGRSPTRWKTRPRPRTPRIQKARRSNRRPSTPSSPTSSRTRSFARSA